MVSHPYRAKTSQAWHNFYGNNTIRRPHAKSQNRPSPPSKPYLMVQSSIVKTNKLRHLEFSAHASTIKRSKLPSWTPPSLNPSTKNPPQSSAPLSHRWQNDMASHTHGPQEKVANFLPATSWPRRRTHSKVAVPSSQLWTLLSGLCSTSWLEWFSNSFQLPALII